MLGRQTKVLEAFQRVDVWLQQNVSPNAPEAVARLCADVSEVVTRAQRAAVHQETGQRLTRAATEELRTAVRMLRNRHLKPIVAIARATSDRLVGIDRACRLPRRRLPVTLLAAEANAVRQAAEPHAQWFVDHGRDAEFLTRLDGAIAETLRVQMRRERRTALHVGATAALKQHLSRARQLVEILDCHVQSVFEGNGAKLAEWHVARRVQAKPGVRCEITVTAPAVAAEEQTPQPRKLFIAA